MATQQNPRTSAAGQLSLVRISEKSQVRLRDYLLQCKNLSMQNWNIRYMMQEVDKAYMREQDYTEENLKAKRANRSGNTNKFRNITVPVVMPQVEAAVTYQSSVFLTGVPLFGVDSSPDYEDQAKQLEAILDNQAIKGGWKRHFMMGFRDAFKYNFMATEVVWDRQIVPIIDTNVASRSANGMEPTNVIWSGNTVKRLDPYNLYWDIRYSVADVSLRGEFAGYDELISRIELKTYLARTPYIIKNNIINAFEAPTVGITIGADYTSLNYYVPQISQIQMLNPLVANQFNWLAWSGLESSKGKVIEYKNIYQKSTLYARIIPSDFEIDAPAPNTPQIWKFVYINNYTLIYAQPCALSYDNLPILFAQPNEDGLCYQTKSLAQNAVDFQDVTSAMMNSVIAARRRGISDRTLYDPSRVAEQHINSDNPSAKIPVRPAAYGKPVSEAVYAFPFRDTESPLLLQEIPQLISMSSELNGQNRAKQGQFVKGNKTRKEFDTVMANANGRDQMTAMGLEDQYFTPLKEMLKLNVLQFQTPETLYSRELQAAVNVDPVSLRRASLTFKVSDGLIPAEKLIQGDALGSALNAIGTTPAIAGGYNMAPMFSYLMKTQGADLAPFEKSAQQQAYEQAAGMWQQTVQMIAEQTLKAGQAVNPASFPPQPTPDQYGWTPGAPTPSQEALSGNAAVMAQWEQVTAAKNTPAAPAQSLAPTAQ
jgi:hypothetical protein